MPVRKILVPLSGQHEPNSPESLELPALETGLMLGRQFDDHVEVFCIEAARSDTRAHLAAVVSKRLDQLKVLPVCCPGDASVHYVATLSP